MRKTVSEISPTRSNAAWHLKRGGSGMERRSENQRAGYVTCTTKCAITEQ